MEGIEERMAELLLERCGETGVATMADIQGIISYLRQRGMGILITDHNVRETLNVVDRAYLVYDGRLLCEGTSEYLVNDEDVRRLYLGEDFRM